MNLLTLLVILAALATITALVCGISAMTSGGEVGHRRSEEWMVWRVGLQALTLALMVFALYQARF